MSWFSKKKDYKTHYDRDGVYRILRNKKVLKDFEIDIIRLSEGYYKVSPSKSLSIGNMSSLTQSINVFVKFNFHNNQVTHVSLSTKPRWEITIAIPVVLILLLIPAITNKGLIEISIVIGVSVFVFLWFKVLYGLQEKSIFESIEKFLKLKGD